MVDQFSQHLMSSIMNAEREGRHDEVVDYHRELLEARLSVYKPNAAPIAGAWTGIASACIAAGMLDEADEAVQKACAIYEETNGPDELALAYATVAELREAQGRMLDARALRAKGEDSGKMVCSFTRVGKACTLSLGSIIFPMMSAYAITLVSVSAS